MENPLISNIRNDINSFLKYTKEKTEFPQLNLKYSNLGISLLYSEIDYCLEIFNKIVIRIINDLDDDKYKLEDLNNIELSFKNCNDNKKKVMYNKIFPEFLKTIITNYVKPELKKTENTIFTLKNYQIEIRNKAANFKERLNHIIISPTGTGKTVIFSIIICDYILKNKKDVIIITKKKEILLDLHTRIEEYITKFTNSNLVKHFNYKITSCVNECSTEILNKKDKNLYPQIYIVNWDKFTSSNATNEKDVDWNKFGLMIIDESHWMSADKISEVMNYIKNETKINYLGFSATPIRTNKVKQDVMLKIFNNGDGDYNVLYEHTYYNALVNKDICPIKYSPIEIKKDDLIEIEYDDKEPKNNKVKYKILSPNAYDKVWEQINTNIISKTHFKKGIFWFRARYDMLTFYNNMKNKMKDFEIFVTMTYTENTKDEATIKEVDKKVREQVKKCGLSKEHFDTAITNFKSKDKNAILLAVMRCTEGFDDDKLEFGARMFYSNKIDPLNESQRMGRFNRWHKNIPDGLKKQGYFSSLELGDSIEDLRKSLIQRFRSWIAFARINATDIFGEFSISEKKKIIEIINLYVDIDTLKTYEIDIEKDIIDSYKNDNFDDSTLKKLFYKLKNQIKEQFKDKNEYLKYAEEHNLEINPDIKYKKWWTNWYDFLGIDISKYPKSKEEWVKKCKEFNIQDSETYIDFAEEIDLPLMPEELYIDFTTIYNELSKKNNRR